MNKTLAKLDKFHKTRRGYAVFGLVEAGLAYAFFSLAVNSGSLWQWALTAILIVGILQNFVKFMDTFIHVSRH